MDARISGRLYLGWRGKVAVVTGGGGVLCGAMAGPWAAGRQGRRAGPVPRGGAEGGRRALSPRAAQAIAVRCDVLDKASIEAAAETVLAAFGRVDILINGAGGNKKQATTAPDLSFFDLPADAIRWVFDLNFLGTLLPSQVFGKLMAEQGEGVILNISSMNAFRPLTRIPAYSAAKAAVSNFTQWLAVHMAQEYSPQHPRQRHRPRLLPDRAEPLPADRREDRRADAARPDDHRPHADGPLRRPGGPAGHGALAAVAGVRPSSPASSCRWTAASRV